MTLSELQALSSRVVEFPPSLPLQRHQQYQLTHVAASHDQRIIILLRRWGCLCAAAAVSLGAYGSHLLDGEDYGTWHKAVLYHLVHSVAIVLYSTAASCAPLVTNTTAAAADGEDDGLRNSAASPSASPQRRSRLARLRSGWVKIATDMKLPAVLFSLGILLFSGSLYVMLLTKRKSFRPLVPVGGTSYILGWLAWMLS